MRILLFRQHVCSFLIEQTLKVFFLSLIIFSASCKKEVNEDCPNCPHVTAVTPDAAHFNDTVVIRGTHLLPNPNYNDVLQVKFNGNLIPGEYIIANYEDSIRLIIPKGTQSGLVTVDINVNDGLVSAGSANFTYIETPVLELYSGDPLSGPGAALGSFLSTQYNNPTQVAVDGANNVYILDSGNDRIVKLDYSTQTATTIVDYSIFTSQSISCIAFANDTLFYSTFDSGTNKSTFRKYGANFYQDPTINRLHVSLAAGQSGEFYISRKITGLGNSLWDAVKVPPYSFGNIFIASPQGGEVLFYHQGFLYVLYNNYDAFPMTTKLSKYSDSTAVETIIINVGSALSIPRGFVVRNNGDIFISDTGNNKIMKFTSAGGLQNVLSALSSPQGMAIDNQGNIYFTETGYHCIRKIKFE